MRKFIDIITEGLTPGMGDREILNHADPEAPAPDPTPNLPVPVNQALAKGEENHFAPQWHRVSDFIPVDHPAVRAIFAQFTTAHPSQIEFVADYLNGEDDVKHMMEWIAHEGQRLGTHVTVPGHVAQTDTLVYRCNGYDFLMCRDALGHTIYACPSSMSIEGPSGAALPPA